MTTPSVPTGIFGESVRLSVSYDGSAVPGRMDARELAPAMLSTAKLFERTAQELYGTTANLKIDVQADFHGGSFTYGLHTIVSRRADNSLDRKDEIVEVLEKIPPVNQESLFPAEPTE